MCLYNVQKYIIACMYTMAMLLCIGPTVNLFIDHSQIVEFTAWKTQLWGDIDIWKDKTLSYKTL